MIRCAAIAIACSPDEQKRLMVIAAASTGNPARNDAIRATLAPCSPSGIAQPMTTSSISWGSRPLAWATASLITIAPRSSGRVARSTPLEALPTAVRTELTITASRTIHIESTHSSDGKIYWMQRGRKSNSADYSSALGGKQMIVAILAAEFNGDEHLHGNGLPIQLRWFKFPTAQRVQSRLTQHKRPRYHVHVGHAAFLIDRGFDHHIAGYARLFRIQRIHGHRPVDQSRFLYLTAAYPRSFGAYFWRCRCPNIRR